MALWIELTLTGSACCMHAMHGKQLVMSTWPDAEAQEAWPGAVLAVESPSRSEVAVANAWNMDTWRLNRGRVLAHGGLSVLTLLFALACSGLFAPPPPVRLGSVWSVTYQAGEWRVLAGDGSVMNRDEWRAIREELDEQGCRYLRQDEYLPTGVRGTLGYFDCDGMAIEVDAVAGERSALVVRLNAPTPVALAEEPVWTGAEVTGFPDAVEAAMVCDAFDEVRLLPDGGLESPVGPPVFVVNEGEWWVDDGTLHIASRYVTPDDVLADASVDEQTCEQARFWTSDGKRGWLCADRYEPCGSGDSAWVSVLGPEASVQRIGRVLAAQPRLGRDIPVIATERPAADALTVTYRDRFESKGLFIASILERDLGVRVELREEGEAVAPVVVWAGGE